MRAVERPDVAASAQRIPRNRFVSFEIGRSRKVSTRNRCILNGRFQSCHFRAFLGRDLEPMSWIFLLISTFVATASVPLVFPPQGASSLDLMSAEALLRSGSERASRLLDLPLVASNPTCFQFDGFTVSTQIRGSFRPPEELASFIRQARFE